MESPFLTRARALHEAHPVVDTLAPNWDAEMYLAPEMAELARRLQADGISRGQIQARLGEELAARIGTDAALREGYLAYWTRAGVAAASTSLLFSGPPSRAWEYVQRSIDRSEQILAGLDGAIVLARSADDVVAAHRRGQRTIVFNCQNADPIGDDLDRVDALWHRGVRIVQVTYNLRNLYGDGCLERRDGGLSRFGASLVERLNRARIVVDVSHSSDQTGFDAIEASDRPIAITHAAARAISGHPRAKPDALLRRVGETGGFVGVVAVPAIISPTGRGATIDLMIDHLLHVMDVAGSAVVGIGTDWGKPYYQVMRWEYATVAEAVQRGGFDWVGWLPEHHFDPNEQCAGLETWDLWPHITARMLERGIAEETVIGIIGGNFLRFWRDATA